MYRKTFFEPLYKITIIFNPFLFETCFCTFQWHMLNFIIPKEIYAKMGFETFSPIARNGSEIIYVRLYTKDLYFYAIFLSETYFYTLK